MNRATAIVITNITSFVVFMISFLLLVKFCNLMKLAVLLAVVRSVAKVTTDKALQEPDVTELSNSLAAY